MATPGQHKFVRDTLCQNPSLITYVFYHVNVRKFGYGSMHSVYTSFVSFLLGMFEFVAMPTSRPGNRL